MEKAALRDKYLEFFKEGGFYILTLLIKRKPVYADNLTGKSFSWHEILELHVSDDPDDWENELLKHFECPENLRLFYNGLIEAIQILGTMDLQKIGKNRTEYQKFYSQLILDTYGCGRNISSIFAYDSTKGDGQIRYDRQRKKALDILIDGILLAEGEKRFTDYDFTSVQALEVVDEMLERIKHSHEEDILRDIKQTFRRIKHHVTENGLEDASAVLFDEIEKNPDHGLIGYRKLETTIIDNPRGDKNSPYCAFTAKRVEGTRTYILTIDGKTVDVKTSPYFKQKYQYTDKKTGSDKYIKFRKDELKGHNVLILAGPAPRTIATEIIVYGDEYLVRAKPQTHAKSYTLMIDDKDIVNSSKPYFYLTDIDPAEHNIFIVANRDIDDLFFLADAGRKNKIKNNLFLDYTDPLQNQATNKYSILFLAEGSLEVISRISPEKYDKIMNVINKKPGSQQKDLWPLACIFTP